MAAFFLCESQVEIACYLTLFIPAEAEIRFFQILFALFSPFCNGDWSLFTVWGFSFFISANSGLYGNSEELLVIFFV